MSSWYNTYRWKVLGAAILILTACLSVYIIWPDFQQVLASYSYLQKQREQATAADNWEFKLAEYKGQQKELDEFISKLFVSLPEEDQMSSIVDLIVGHSKSTGLNIRTMRPLEREVFDTYTVIPLALSLRGSYHETGAFVNKLEKASHLVRLKNVTMKAGNEIPVRDLSVSIELTVTLLRNDETGKEGEEL